MPKPSGGGSSSDPPKKKKRKLDKRNKKKSAQAELSAVCNITGIGGDDGQGLAGDTIDDIWGNEFDCLNELATAQEAGASSSSANTQDDTKSVADERIQSQQTLLPQTPPPTLKEIPNLRVELARHLQVESLSTFLLQACPGLRMPTFERWLLDSKLEESDRLQSIAENWITDPSSKLQFKNQKKKYGRAALHSEENNAAQCGREDARRMRESRILLDAEKSIANEGSKLGKVDRLVMKTRSLIDAVLPGNPLETDPSCMRLIDEIVALKLKMNDKSSDETNTTQEEAGQVAKELLSRCSESVKEIQQLQNRFGTYQQFNFDKKKRSKNGSSTSGLVRAEWVSDESKSSTKKPSPDSGGDSVCSLSYITTKKKSSSSASSTSLDNNDDVQKKTKPFIVKVNGQHYHKLRRLFDKTYDSVDSSLTKDQLTHAFHAALFAIIIRYSTLAGGQQLNVLRGGGMQGAIHDTVFDCFATFFGTNNGPGVECFASPFNSNMTQYFSAFASPDIDGFFGSHGDFFRLDGKTLRPGWYEANPPFSPGVMEKMAKRLIELLNVARERDIDVTFLVVVPSCRIDRSNDTDGQDASHERKKKKMKKKKKRKHNNEEHEKSNTNALTNAIHHSALSSFNMLVENCSSHIVLSKREHGYVEGSQHLRPTQFKESQYDTSVIVLRSKRCTDFDTETFEADLRKAFKSRHLIELQQRRDCD